MSQWTVKQSSCVLTAFVKTVKCHKEGKSNRWLNLKKKNINHDHQIVTEAFTFLVVSDLVPCAVCARTFSCFLHNRKRNTMYDGCRMYNKTYIIGSHWLCFPNRAMQLFFFKVIGIKRVFSVKDISSKKSSINLQIRKNTFAERRWHLQCKRDCSCRLALCALPPWTQIGACSSWLWGDKSRQGWFTQPPWAQRPATIYLMRGRNTIKMGSYLHQRRTPLCRSWTWLLTENAQCRTVPTQTAFSPDATASHRSGNDTLRE